MHYIMYMVGMGFSIHGLFMFVGVADAFVETGHCICGVVVFNGLLCSEFIAL